jgi:hypothetical protein
MLHFPRPTFELMRDDATVAETAIQQIKSDLAKLGPMRPGSLSVQYRDRKNRTGQYHQLSYTHGGRSRTERVHPDHLMQVEKEISNFKRFRELTKQWIELSIKASEQRRKFRDGMH